MDSLCCFMIALYDQALPSGTRRKFPFTITPATSDYQDDGNSP